ncbi:MAG: efflux RND transporter permease subunit, partial [Acidobacteriota bacterium]
MSLPTLAVRRPITIAMALASVLLFGSIALSRLPLAFLPAVDVPFIFVQIPYPNANPAQIEREITKPVEEVLATLSGVKKMRATSTADEAQLRLEFNWGEDLDVVRMQVSEKLDQIAPDLPEGTGEILIFSFNTTDIPVVEARIGATGVDLSESYPLIESRIVNRLRRLPGVARVDLDGVEPREIFIDLEIDKIKAYRVDVGNLIGRLQAAAGNQVLGEVSQDGMRYTARSLGDFDSVDAVRRLPIDENGLVLEDVAEISYEEPPIAWGRHLNLNDAVALLVFKESTANTVDVVRDVMATIDGDISEDPLLKGVDVFVWNDQGEQITNAVDGLTKSGLIGALMAIVVLYFFLRRIRPTLIVSLSIPFSIIAACGVLYFMGKSLNVLSMMGLMLGVGMLVDNAIVVLESIDRTSRDVPDKAEAASRGATHVWLAVLASTATSLIVFLPLVVGSKSELSTWLGEIGLTICLALVCSLVSSLTLIPMAASKFLPPAKDVKPFAVLVWLEDRYAAILGWTLRRPRATFGVLSIILVIGFLPFFIGMVDANMFSGGVNKRMYLRYDFVDFAYKSRAEATVDQVEAVLWPRLEEFEIESIYSYFRSNEAGTTLTVARDDMSDEEFKALRGELREILPTIPGVRLVFDNDNDSGGDSTFFSVNFFGQDVDELTRIAGEARRRLETVDGMFDVSTSLDRGRREVEVEIDRAKAARLGMTAQDVTEVVGFALGGVRLPRFNAGDRGFGAVDFDFDFATATVET